MQQLSVEKTELEKAAVAEKEEWLKEEEEGDPLLVSITIPQVCTTPLAFALLQFQVASLICDSHFSRSS